MREPVIVGETESVLAIDKPAGLIVHSDGRTKEPSLAEWLARIRPELCEIGEPWVSPQGEQIAVSGIAHRLDRTTSGVVLVAKTNEVFAELKAMFKARRVRKIYRAVVYGGIAPAGEIIAEIMRSSTPPRRWYARPCDESDTRAAITAWRLLKTLESEDIASYIEVEPRTGRTHQIRVHCASIGHPIVADHLYAPERAPILGFTRPALHAFSITLTINGREHTFTAPLPLDFQRVA